jgi:hypothetical protein
MSGEPNLYGTFFGTEEHEARMRALYRRRAARVGLPPLSECLPRTDNKKNKKGTK